MLKKEEYCVKKVCKNFIWNFGTFSRGKKMCWNKKCGDKDRSYHFIVTAIAL